MRFPLNRGIQGKKGKKGKQTIFKNVSYLLVCVYTNSTSALVKSGVLVCGERFNLELSNA